MNSTKALRSIAVFAVAGILAGCASAPQSSSSALPIMMQQAETPMTCKSDHGVSVKPCSINLSLSNPQESVTTKGPTGTFSFNGAACKNKHIATIAGSGHTFRATWGTSSGSCTTVFTDKTKAGKTIGTASLHINNRA
ncbi:MAG: hypothetical protein WAJ94_05725 [Candidatus Cybelea sp.]